jgi:magnesium transporter
VDTVEVLRDLVADAVELYLSSATFRTNEVVKLLTMMASIFIPLTFLVGVYGMNFDYMPELRVWWAYPLVMGLMLAIALGMLIWFRRKRWL